MGHRHFSNSLQLFEMDQDQNRSHVTAGQSYIHMGRSVAPQTGPLVYPSESVPTRGLYTALPQDFESRPIEHSSSFRFGGPSVPAPLRGPAYGSFPHFPAGRSYYPAPENNAGHAHSSHGFRNNIHEVEGGLLDHAMGTVRGPLKRKSPSFTVPSERGSTSRFHSAGSSSSSFEFQPEKPTSDYQNYPSSSNGLPHYRVGGLSIRSEDPPRNVRIRSRLDMEPDPGRTYLSSYSSHHHSTTHLSNHSGAVVNADSITYDQNHISASPAVHGRFQTPGNTGLRHDMNQYFVGGSSAEIDGYSHDSISSRNPVSPPQYPNGLHVPGAREGCNNYSRGAIPSYRAGLSSSRLPQEATPSENGLQLLTENYSSRHRRPFSARGWRNNRRDTGPRITLGRFQSFSNAVDARDRMGSEDLMMMDHSFLYGSRNLFDQYRDMRLDIDNMSYEELLDLGERIGNVNTGLSEDVISKCLMETIYSSTDKNPEETTCAICLEEYNGEENIGTVKKCGHAYHAVCIKKWLLMKNACPICKTPAHAESAEEK